jgi:GNAT superfamily N-acetyltransferase
MERLQAEARAEGYDFIVRRVYVRPAWQDKGIGRALVTSLVEEARTHFSCVRLRAENTNAARLYERIGFTPIASLDATHILLFDEID